MNKYTTVIFLLVAACAAAQQARACATHGTTTTNSLAAWLDPQTEGDVVRGILVFPTALVPPQQQTTCAGGVGVGSHDNVAPDGLTVTAMRIVVMNTITGLRVPIHEFAFSPNALTSEGLAAGSDDSDPSAPRPLIPGATWFGFSALVQPLTAPVLGPEETVAFEFALQIPKTVLPVELDVQFAGGEGHPDGSPVFDGDHPVSYFAPPDTTVAFTDVVSVQIDIKPGSDPNSINLDSAWVVPVAILGAADFDATTVNPTTVSLAGASITLVGKSDKFMCHEDDVNQDGFVDFVCQIFTAQFMIEEGQSTAVLEAETYAGVAIRGEDSIRIVP